MKPGRQRDSACGNDETKGEEGGNQGRDGKDVTGVKREGTKGEKRRERHRLCVLSTAYRVYGLGFRVYSKWDIC